MKKQKIQLKIQLFEEQNMSIKDWIHEVSLSSFIILLLFCFCTDRFHHPHLLVNEYMN